MNVDAAALATAYQVNKRALTTYLTRMVVREDIAEELAQQTAVRALEQPALPSAPDELRAWLFRVATNLAIDHLRRHGTWREEMLTDTRARAMASEGFVAASRLLVGNPETRSVAKEHLVVCFSCTLRNLEPQESAALLLKHVYDFSVEEVACIMDATFAQAKNWIQAARAKLRDRYASSCALVSQTGVCFQCVELDRFFGANAGDPLADTKRDVDARLAVLREQREQPLNAWHRGMMGLIAEILED
jgi:RNA polymerase sigma-70 factor, ECF subfamily